MVYPQTTVVAGRIALSLLIALDVGLAEAQRLDFGADALLAIDQHRASVVQRVVDGWGPVVAKSSANVTIDELRTPTCPT